MNWLILSWALTMGYLPANTTSIMDSPRGNYFLQNDDSYSVKFEVSAEALNHLRVWGSMENFSRYADVDAGMGGWFSPFEDVYQAGVALYAEGIEIGGTHECRHGVKFSSKPNGWLGGSYTKFYIKLSGKTGS